MVIVDRVVLHTLIIPKGHGANSLPETTSKFKLHLLLVRIALISASYAYSLSAIIKRRRRFQ